MILHEKNKGKGAALRTGFQKATGQICVIQDADLEYDPREYPILIEPILRNKADVVFGSRFQSGRPHRVVYFWHRVGNGFLTLMSNFFTDLNLSDMETLEANIPLSGLIRNTMQNTKLYKFRAGKQIAVCERGIFLSDFSIKEVCSRYPGKYIAPSLQAE